MRTYVIKIKTATGTRRQVGIFCSSFAALDAGIDLLGEAQGNVTVKVLP